jgi:FAD/FMN-containing dehydrogenase
MGVLQRQWGLACDNLLSVEIVTAEGEVLRASLTEHPDLFWAVRGGGGNLGIVTWLEYQLHSLGPEVYSAATIYPFDGAKTIVRAGAPSPRRRLMRSRATCCSGGCRRFRTCPRRCTASRLW